MRSEYSSFNNSIITLHSSVVYGHPEQIRVLYQLKLTLSQKMNLLTEIKRFVNNHQMTEGH